MTASGTKTPTLTALQRGSVVVFAIVLAFAFALSMSAESAFAQPDNGEGAGVLSTASVQNPDGTLAPDAETSDTANLEASSADVQASGTNGVDATTVTGNSPASVSEDNENDETPEGAQQPTDKYKATIVVGENQKREYNGAAIGDDEYYVEVSYEDSGETIRYYPRDSEDVGDFSFMTDAGEPLDQAPTNAGSYRIQAHILATVRHAARTLESPFEITKKIVPIPTVPTTVAYTGEEQRVLADADLYTVEGGSATEAGTYTARVTLKDPDNYTFENGDSLNNPHVGFLDIAWAIESAAGSQGAQQAGYSWEVTPASNPDLTFGNMTAQRASSLLVAKIMAVRDGCINRLSSIILNIVKLTRALFPGQSL